MAIYSPELFQSEQEFLIEPERRWRSQRVPRATAEAVLPHERLRLLGVPDEEIARLAAEGKRVRTRLVLRRPSPATVLESAAWSSGQYVGADTPLLRSRPTSHARRVLADLYEMDDARVHAGDAARFTTDALLGRAFAGRVEFVYPTVSNETRTR